MTDLDASDWRRVLDGDPVALGSLFARHAPRLFRHASRFLSVREDAKDAVVIAYYELWSKRASVRLVDGSPLPWLVNAVTYTARNLERASRRYRQLLERAERDAAEAADVGDLAYEASADDRSDVSTVLDRLTPRERSVIVLTVIEGYSERDAASALGVPVGTVKSRLARAKARLRDQLSDLQEA